MKKPNLLSFRLINQTCIPLTVDVLVTRDVLVVSVLPKDTISVNLDELAQISSKPLGFDGTRGQGVLFVHDQELSADGVTPPMSEAEEDDSEDDELDDEVEDESEDESDDADDDDDDRQRMVTYELDNGEWGDIDLLDYELEDCRWLRTLQGMENVLEAAETQTNELLPYPLKLSIWKSSVNRLYLAIVTERAEMQ